MIGKSQPRAKVPHGSGGTIYPVALESFFVRWSLFVAFQRKIVDLAKLKELSCECYETLRSETSH
jgi:hypothetical protein